MASGFRDQRVRELPRLGVTLHELVHERTGARHVHLASGDDNRAFAVAFSTPPPDSTGVAHILEHVVLSGSRRFPVRDVFFSMRPRSLATFMNAFTGADRTIYPFSTRNLADYWNLLEVYGDAAFHPRLDEDSFRQEGWRWEFEDPGDPASPLRIKGVVYNEMKGALAQPAARMHQALTRALLAGTPYAFQSGGDPDVIPDLTWQGLRDFHARHYQPANAVFITAGDLDLEEVLQRIEGAILAGFRGVGPAASVPDARPLAEPVEVRHPVPRVAGQEGQALLAWLVGRTADPFHVLAFRILADALLGNAGAPLRKALTDSRLGSAPADGGGFNPGYRQTLFGAGLKDVRPDAAEGVQEVVLATLERIASEGLDTAMVDAAVHRLEIEERERSNVGLPYTLRLALRVSPALIHGGDPYDALNLDAELARLAAERAAPGFFERLIRDRLIDNAHRALVVLEPDSELEARSRAREQERVSAAEAGLDEQRRAALVAAGLRLKEAQERAQDLSVLPGMRPQDVALSFPEVPRRDAAGGIRSEAFPQPANGIAYLELRSDATALPGAMLDDLNVLASVLTQLGAAGHDYAVMARRIAAATGGVGAAVVSVRGVDRAPRLWLSLGGKALVRDVDELAAIIRDLTSAPAFEPERLRELIAQTAVQHEAAVTAMGHLFAGQLAASQLTEAAALAERVGGLSAMRRLRRLRDLDPAGLEELGGRLESLRRQVFAPERMLACLTAEEPDLPALERLAATVASSLRAAPEAGPPARVAARPRRAEARVLTSPVAHNATAYPTVEYTHPDAAVLEVLAQYLGNVYMHREVRERGGAYGGRAGHDALAGMFAFHSYRDPHIVRTLDVMAAAPAWLEENGVDPDRLTEAILEACRDLDPLESPDTRGSRASLRRHLGLLPELQAEFGERLLRVNADDLLRVAREYLRPEVAAVATIAGQAAVDAAIAERPGVFESVEPAWD